MSDTEENPLKESRESGEMQKEEEEEAYNPSFEEDNLQQSLTEGTLSWEESQEDREGLEKWMEKEEQIEGEDMRGEEEEMRGEDMRGEEEEMRGGEMRGEEEEMRGGEMREEEGEMRGEEEEMRGGEMRGEDMRREEEETRRGEMRGEEEEMRGGEMRGEEEEMRGGEMRGEEGEMRGEEMRGEEEEMRGEEEEMGGKEEEMRGEEEEMREEEMRVEEEEMRAEEEEMRGVEEREERGEEEEKRWKEEASNEEEKSEEKERSKEKGGEEEHKEKEEEEYKGESEEGREEEKEKSGKWEEEESIVLKKVEREAGEAQEERKKQYKRPIHVDDIDISSESSMSRSSLTGASGSSKSSSHSHSPEVSQIYKDISMNMVNIEEAAIGSQEENGQKPEDISAQGKDEARKLSSLDEGQKLFQSKDLSATESLVSISTEDTLFQKEEDFKLYPLSMTWSFGWNSSLPVFYMREDRRVILYICSHTAVIYDVFRNTQYHLQGHPNIISCLCVSEDRRWIATADKGPDCLIIIWDAFTGIPVHTIFDSCPDGNGIRSIAITRDSKFLATISDSEIQKVCIWKWTLAVETPACTLELPKEYGSQENLIFNPANNKEMVSNSKTQAVYYCWFEDKGILAHSAPLLTEKPRKLVHLQKEAITVLTTVDSYIVTGDIKGNIKFYDHTLSVVNWYSNFKLSAIRTLSFSKTLPSPPTEKSNLPTDCTLRGDLFVVRNFIIGTFDATVYHMTVDGTKLEKLFVEPRDAIYAISCHPYQPLVAVGSVCGMIKVWDFEKKVYLFSRTFEKGLGVQCLTYNPAGTLLGAGFTEGTVYILDAMSLENESSEPFKYSKSSVSHISFSHDSSYMATADTNCTVAVYMMVVKNGQRDWEYLARLRSHHNSIRSLLFGVHLDSNEPRLLSLGKDRFLIEYNLVKSYKDHLEVLDIHRTDQGNYPTCMIWYPPLTKELFLLICNSGYKVKLFNATTKMCRKTLLGPAYGSPIEHAQVLPVKSTLELQKRYLVFINKDKVGLQILPVDGNPHKTCAIVCHPNGVAGMALSYDGSYAFTAGGQDRSVVQWKINLGALEAAVSLGGEDLTPFYGLVSGGREGKFYRELEDYFYYSQIRSQGIDTMETRQVSEHICLSELPFVMRAIGFYPSEEKGLLMQLWPGTCRLDRSFKFIEIHLPLPPECWDQRLLKGPRVGDIVLQRGGHAAEVVKGFFYSGKIEDMFNEIKFSEYVDTGKLIDKINLPDFLKVYLNHRPPFGNTMDDIQKSFNVLGFTNSEGKKAIRREDFLNLLLTKGEHMTEEEMFDCFATLFGLTPEGWKSEPAATFFNGPEICLQKELPEEITAEIFMTEILGLTLSNSSEQLNQ